ncbi:NOL7 protein, partial [Sapayoa aenigma]|nr:NOL7 protein [Sapayoa aenigma]
ATGKRRAPAALPIPASSSEDEADEAPEEVSFGVAREAAEAERKLVGEAARRHRELLKEKRRRHQELFTEQKKRRLLPEAVLQELQELQDLATAAPPERCCCTQVAKLDTSVFLGSVTKIQGFTCVFLTRSQGNYMAVCLKDQGLTGLHQQLAKDFLNAQLYGPHTNRVQGKQFCLGLHLVLS